MASDQLRALAARVLGEEPSRELDADIWDALGLTYAAELAARDWMRRHKNRPRRDYLLTWSPAFTASHDVSEAGMSRAQIDRVIDMMSTTGTVLISSEAALPPRAGV